MDNKLEFLALPSVLTNRERKLMRIILEDEPERTIRSEAEWLKCRGLGPRLLAKLRHYGMVGTTKQFPSDLSARACNALERSGLEISKNVVKAALETGAFKPSHVRSIGKTTEKELRVWAGLPEHNPNIGNKCIPRRIWKFHPLTGERYP
jgi:hypothetical protein